MPFTTLDVDNDNDGAFNCADFFKGGGWWANLCYLVKLNGIYSAVGSVASSGDGGILWHDVEASNLYSFKESKMMFRPT